MRAISRVHLQVNAAMNNAAYKGYARTGTPSVPNANANRPCYACIHLGVYLQVTMTEINAAYNAFAKTGAPPKPCPEFPELQLSYTDFALWQRGRVQPGGGLETQVSNRAAYLC